MSLLSDSMWRLVLAVIDRKTNLILNRFKPRPLLDVSEAPELKYIRLHV